MFVVKRPFKSLGKVYTAGSVITEPASIKRFNGKLAEGKIIDVTKQTYGHYAEYFKAKFGVALPPIDANTEPNPEANAEPIPEANAEPIPEANAEPIPEANAEPIPEANAEPKPNPTVTETSTDKVPEVKTVKVVAK